MTHQLEIDRFGRVLIPKKLREQLGLQPGERLEVDLAEGQLILRPTSRTAALVEHQGRLIFEGYGALQGDPVEDLRQSRLDEVLPTW